MKTRLLILGLFILSLSSCKDCIECKYSTFKGTVTEKYCSSTKQDRVDFENEMDSLAANEGSKAICTKERY